MKRRLLLVIALLLAVPPTWAQSAPAPPADKKGDVLQSEQFSDAVASALLSRIQAGFTRRNAKVVLSAFDPQHFPGFALFADRVRARLGQSYGFRAYFRILDRTVQDPRPTATVELQIEQSSTTPGVPPVRNTGQARFTFERGPAGWRIVDVSPRDLLTGVRGPA